MRANFEAAARHSTAYYGQLARARLGLNELELQTPPEHASAASVELLRAAELLYAIGERDLVLSFLTGVAEQSDDAAGLASLAGLAARNDDATAALLVGKTGLARGLPLDIHAFPDIGVPPCSPIGPALFRSIVYSVAHTESEFNQRVVSPANERLKQFVRGTVRPRSGVSRSPVRRTWSGPPSLLARASKRQT